MNKVLYLTTMAPPAVAGTDAVMQDVEFLIQTIGGAHRSIYPLRRPSRFVPHWAMGWLDREALKADAEKSDLIHLFSATLKPIPALSSLKRPIVYSVKASLGADPQAAWFNRHGVQVIVNNERDLNRARAVGLDHVHLLYPVLDLARFTFTPAPADTPFRLMIGSAPWTKAQFKSKGIHALVSAAKQLPDLHLVFLWRNWMIDSLHRMIEEAGIKGQTTIYNEKMDVNQVLADCHASVVLAENERLVKAWPHSALESLAAGKPVILSKCIAMADYVAGKQCGHVLADLDEHLLVESIRSLMANHRQLGGSAMRDQVIRDFHPDRLGAIQSIYAAALK